MKNIGAIWCHWWLMVAATAFGADEPAPPRPTHVLVSSVESVTIRTLESFPEQLHISARGKVSTGGWSDATLRQRTGARDGIYEFDFLAQPPSGVAAQVIRPIEATTTMTKPKDFRAIRVFTRSNSKEAK